MAGNDLPSQSGFESKPFDAQVTSVNPAKEQVQVDSAAGPDNIFVPHPMMSTNSWIRAMPEKGARIGTMASAGTMRRMGLCYYTRAAAEYIEQYSKGHGLYRPLEPGEWELMSSGVAHVYGNARGQLYLRGGVVQGELDPIKLRSRWRAPTHVRELHFKQDTDVFDEERLGVVIRNLPSGEKDRWQRAPGDKSAFAKEYLRVFGRGGSRLVAVQEGDCLDKDGKEIKAFTGKRTRAYREYYDGSGGVVHQQEIDEAGSVQIRGLASEVKVLEPDSSMQVQISQLQVDASRTISLSAGTNFEAKATAVARIQGTTQTILGPTPAPIDPVIRGLLFMSTVLVPFLSLLQKHFEWVGKPPPDGPPPAPPMLGQLKVASAVLAQQIAAIQALTTATLSLNVFTT